MSRQRLTIGTFGQIGYLDTAGGRVVARARYRDWDGKTRLVQATGESRAAAERALKAKLADRSLFQHSFSALTPDSAFSDLVTYWLEELELEDRLSQTTRQLYERNMRTLVIPAFRNLTGTSRLNSAQHPKTGERDTIQVWQAGTMLKTPGLGARLTAERNSSARVSLWR